MRFFRNGLMIGVKIGVFVRLVCVVILGRCLCVRLSVYGCGFVSLLFGVVFLYLVIIDLLLLL